MTYTLDQIKDAIYKELESAGHLGRDLQHYYYIIGVVTSALNQNNG